MGMQDVTEKILEAYDDVFADIVNALLFRGKQIINPADLTDAQNVSTYKLDDSIKWQERDVSKYWQKNKMKISCFGFENQTKVDYAMPIRTMNYDAAEYYKQIGTTEPYYPVITLVLYFGTKQKWTKKKSLFDLFEDSVSKELLPYINDYKLNVFDLAWLTDEEISYFKSDFKLVVEYLRAERTGNVEDWDKQKVEHIHELINLLRSISDNEILKRTEIEDFIIQTQQKTGGVKMSGLFQTYWNKGHDEGIALGVQKGISQGRTEGISIGRTEGINSMTALMSSLYAQGRDEDVKRAFTDSAYLQELLANYKG